MSAQPLFLQNFFSLRIAYRKKSANVEKKRIDYYPFGMPMPNRQLVNGEPYRYAYQGQEKDPETGKEAFQLRLWDSRIGRWLTTDPAGQYFSPYMAMGNSPISQVDPDGGTACPDPPCNGSSNLSDGAVVYNQTVPGLKPIESLSEIGGGNSSSINMNTTLWDFSHQMEQFRNDTKAIVDKGGIPSAYSIQGYLDSYEMNAMSSGRTNVTFQDVADVDAAAFNAFSMIVPVGRVFQGLNKTFNAFRGFRHAVTITKGSLAPVGRALQKHPNISRVITAGTITTNALRNQVGMKALQHIMRNGVRTVKNTKRFGSVVDFKLASGLGARFNATTNQFIGFLGRGL